MTEQDIGPGGEIRGRLVGQWNCGCNKRKPPGLTGGILQAGDNFLKASGTCGRDLKKNALLLLRRAVFVCGIRFRIFTQQRSKGIGISCIIDHIRHLSESICERKANIPVVPITGERC